MICREEASAGIWNEGSAGVRRTDCEAPLYKFHAQQYIGIGQLQALNRDALANHAIRTVNVPPLYKGALYLLGGDRRFIGTALREARLQQ